MLRVLLKSFLQLPNEMFCTEIKFLLNQFIPIFLCLQHFHKTFKMLLPLFTILICCQLMLLLDFSVTANLANCFLLFIIHCLFDLFTHFRFAYWSKLYCKCTVNIIDYDEKFSVPLHAVMKGQTLNDIVLPISRYGPLPGMVWENFLVSIFLVVILSDLLKCVSMFLELCLNVIDSEAGTIFLFYKTSVFPKGCGGFSSVEYAPCQH